ncbi:hypothetical protein RB595_009096 [Gaeumannomyces hyphopodioides]
MANRNVDYSLYLVTDSTPAILGGRDICAVVEQALRGGVTVVQYRDKTSDTRELVDVATRLHRLTREHNVPLLINDRVDVALAVGCEGVHLGQDDMSLEDARRLLGPDAIIGISVNNGFEAIKACYGGADYLGVGAVFATPTKADTRSILGTAGLQYILGMLTRRPACRAVPAVAIGGINRTNVQRVFYQSEVWPFKRLHGVAVVSAIVAAPDPEAAARELRRLVRDPPPFATLEGTPQPRDPAEILALVPGVIGAMHETTPLSHNMTNLVVQNFSANVALAVGASPIMSNFGEEAADLARLGGALVVNMGTVTPEGIGNYIKAIKAYNLVGRPVVFDPVGYRRRHRRPPRSRQGHPGRRLPRRDQGQRGRDRDGARRGARVGAAAQGRARGRRPAGPAGPPAAARRRQRAVDARRRRPRPPGRAPGPAASLRRGHDGRHRLRRRPGPRLLALARPRAALARHGHRLLARHRHQRRLLRLAPGGRQAGGGRRGAAALQPVGGGGGGPLPGERHVRARLPRRAGRLPCVDGRGRHRVVGPRAAQAARPRGREGGGRQRPAHGD